MYAELCFQKGAKECNVIWHFSALKEHNIQLVKLSLGIAAIPEQAVK